MPSIALSQGSGAKCDALKHETGPGRDHDTDTRLKQAEISSAGVSGCIELSTSCCVIGRVVLKLKSRCTGLDPRILAALAAAQRVNAPGGQPQGRNNAAYRRSVDMGMLAHAAAMGGAGRHGGNSAGFPKQFGEQTSIPEGSPVSFTVTHPTLLCVYCLQPGEFSLPAPL